MSKEHRIIVKRGFMIYIYIIIIIIVEHIVSSVRFNYRKIIKIMMNSLHS